MDICETKTILLAEDDPSACLLLRTILQENGYLMLIAHTGEEAMKIAQDFPGEIHLLLTDVVTPHIDGLALTYQLAAIRPEMQVLYMSCYPYSMLETRKGKLKSDCLLPKPYGNCTLFEKIKEMLETPGTAGIEAGRAAGTPRLLAAS